MKITLSEFKQKYLKLILAFEKETGKKAIWSNNLTKQFIHWLRQKLNKNKTLTCDICGRVCKGRYSLANHKKWHRSGYRENRLKKIKEVWNRKGYRESRSGENAPNYGKFGEDNPSFKENAGYNAKHMWINIHFPQKEVCDDKCEICGRFSLHLDLAQFRNINKRNADNPMIDYMYICHINEKNSCHRIYDENLSDKEKKKLLEGATTRKEKLKRVREYVLKVKRGINKKLC